MRRRRRALYTALGVAIGVAAVIAVMTVARSGEARIYQELDKYGPNLVVSPAVNDMDLQLGSMTLGSLAVGENYISEDKLPEIRLIADGAIRESLGLEDEGDISTIAPKLFMNTEINGNSVTVVGFDPEEEIFIKSWWIVSSGDYPELEDEAVVGARVGPALDMDVGDNFWLKDQEVTVVGVLEETGSADDFQVFVPLGTVQRAFEKEGLISSLDIRALCLGCPVEEIADALNGSIKGVRAVAVKQIAATEMGLMQKVNRFMLALAGIALIVGVFGVVNTMLSSVYERIRDIGIMKAVGASRRQIVTMFLYEALVIGLAGGILGFVAGSLLSYVIGPLIFEDLAVAWAPQYIAPALGIAILVAGVASVYPAYRASKVSVADAIRSL
jgi:putative ABC transport system permease protein